MSCSVSSTRLHLKHPITALFTKERGIQNMVEKSYKTVQTLQMHE